MNEFIGFIEGTLLLVDQMFSGEIVLGSQIIGASPGTVVVKFGTGIGGAGSYYVNIDQVVAGPDFTFINPPVSTTGPPYPPPPAAGSNQIGKFVIGKSPIGDIIPFNWWLTMISQYANSPVITQLLQNMDIYLDQTQNLDEFYDNVFNLGTAQQWGLDVWGRILGLSRTLTLNLGGWFGFAEAGETGTGFNQGAFYSGVGATSNFVMNDTSYRMALLTRAAFNISDGSIPSINQMLRNMFPGRGNAYVTDGAPAAGPFFGFAEAGLPGLGFNQAQFYAGQGTNPGMVMTYTFKFPLSPIELALVETPGLLPKPTGVKATVVIDI